MKSIVLLLLAFSQFSIFAQSRTERLLHDELERSTELNKRIEIVRTLKSFIQGTRTQDAIEQILMDQREHSLLRQEAAYALSLVADRSQITRSLGAAHDRSNDLALRAAILKSMYKSASRDNNIQRVMTNNLRENHHPDIKKASAFGLMNSLTSQSDRRPVLEVLENRMENPEVRVEIIKSLFDYKGYNDVERVIESIIADQRDHLMVRSAAVKLYSHFPASSQKERLLHSLVTQAYGQVAIEAVKGLKAGEMSESEINWFHLSHYPNTRGARDPLQN